MQHLTLLITVPLALFAILFVLANPEPVTFYLWPDDEILSLTAPGWQFGLGLLFGGFFLGALFVWLLRQKARFRYWQESRRAARLEKELDALHRAAEAAGATDDKEREPVPGKATVPAEAPLPITAGV